MKTEDNGTYVPKFETFIPVSEPKETELTGWGKRHQQCLLLFLALTAAYSMRTCMGLSLVAMTESTHHVSSEHHLSNSSSNITRNVNGTLMIHDYETNDTRLSAEEEKDVGGFLLIPPYPKFKWDKKTQDMILSSFTWGYMLLQIPAGQLVHNFGSRYLLTGALMINSLISILTPWLAYYGGWVLLVVARIVQGLSQACILPGLHTFLGKWAPVEERGRLSAFIFGGQALGTVLGFPLTGFVASSPLGWPGIFRMYGILSGIMGGFIWWLTADSPSQHKSISAAERRYIEEKMGQTGKKKRPIPWKHILRSKGLCAIVVAHIGATWGILTLYSEIPAYLDLVLGVNIKANGLLSALPYFMMFLANFFFSWFTDMLIVKGYLNLTNTRKLATTLGHAPSMIGLIVLAYAPKNIYVVETLLVIICSFNIAGHVGFYINHIDIAPNYSGTLMSISNFAANACGSLAPLVAGFILTDPTDVLLWRKVFFVTAALFFITNVVYLFMGTAERAEWDDPQEEKKDIGAMEPMIKNNKQ